MDNKKCHWCGNPILQKDIDSHVVSQSYNGGFPDGDVDPFWQYRCARCVKELGRFRDDFWNEMIEIQELNQRYAKKPVDPNFYGKINIQSEEKNIPNPNERGYVYAPYVPIIRGQTPLIVSIDDDGHFAVSFLFDKKESVQILKSFTDTWNENNGDDFDYQNASEKEFEEFVYEFVQRGRLEILKI